MKTAIIVAAFGALALVGCKDKSAETTNPDAAAPAVEEAAPTEEATEAAEEAPAEEAAEAAEGEAEAAE